MIAIAKEELERLVGGEKFDRDELILIKLENSMITIRQSEPEEIQYWRYNLNSSGNAVELKNVGCDRIIPEHHIFNLYRQKLMEAGLWQ